MEAPSAALTWRACRVEGMLHTALTTPDLLDPNDMMTHVEIIRRWQCTKQRWSRLLSVCLLHGIRLQGPVFMTAPPDYTNCIVAEQNRMVFDRYPFHSRSMIRDLLCVPVVIS